MYPHYVPIQRVDKNAQAIGVPLDTRRTGINSPIKKAKGGSSDISPLFETIANRTLQTYRASARNSLGLELMNSLETLGELNGTNEVADLDSTIETLTTDNNEDLLQKGKNGQNPTFTVFRNGEKVTFDVNDDIYDALKPKDRSAFINQTFVPAQKFSNLRRGVLTEYNPVFLVTNSIKDAQDVLMNSQHALKTYSKFPEAYAQILKKGYWYNEYIQNGGEQNSYFTEGEFAKKEKGILPNAKNVLKLPLNAIASANNVIELAPRLSEYIASREQGRSIQTSMLDASRVTTNFKAGGDFTRFLNRNGATFLNAGVQGAVQTARNVREANMKGLKGWTTLAMKTAVAGLPAVLLNNLLWKDDDDYEELQDYVKDNYYIIGKIGDNKFLRIPKGRTISVIQKLVSNVDQYLNNKKELNIDSLTSDFWKDMKFAVEQLAPNNPIDNNIISPLVQAKTNKTWYGEDLVPSRLQKMPKAEQYDESTDSISKAIGKATNTSPIKINYILDQYLGGAGDVLLPKLTPQAENDVVEDKFTTDSVMKSRYPGEFFESMDKLETQSNSEYATDEDILKYKYGSDIRSKMSDLYKEKRQIQNSDETDEVKKAQLKDVQKEINALAKEGLNNVEKVNVTGDTAKVGDLTFTKDKEGKWTKLTNDIEGLSDKTFADYTNKITDIKKTKGKGEQVTETEKKQVLLDSNYSNTDKDKIYSQSFGKDDDTYSAFKDIGSIDEINQYLDYTMQKFESDKIDDGTMKGKSVTKGEGTKKSKVQKYLSESSFTPLEKLFLYGKTYKLDSGERADFNRLISEKNLTPEQKKKVYLNLNGVVEMADGSVAWK